METTVGIFETKGYSTALAAAEKILENKNVELLKLKKTGGGIISLFFKGNAAELKTAFEKGVQYARTVGQIVSLYVLNHVDKNLKNLFAEKETEAPSPVNPPKPKLEEKISKEKSQEVVKKSEPTNSLKKEKILIDKSLEVTKQKIESTQPEKIKQSKFLATSSTIQRLRKEALANESFEKEKTLKQKPSGRKASAEINMNNLEKMNVHELRRFARSRNGFPIQGRQISRANRGELLNYFKELA